MLSGRTVFPVSGKIAENKGINLFRRGMIASVLSEDPKRKSCAAFFLRRNGENMVNERKCAVVGCGNVGAACAYTLACSGLFSELVLIDANGMKAEGEAMDISDGLPFLSPMRVAAGSYRDIAECGCVVVAAGANQKQGETRLALLKKNVRIIEDVCRSVSEYNDEAVLLIVTNPVDVLTTVAQRASGYPKSRVLGSGTVLDTARMKQLLGERLGLDPRNVHSIIIGEHGDSEVPVWSSSNISGVDLAGFCGLDRCADPQLLDGIFTAVRDSAYRIIERKGATYYAIAQSVLRILRAIVRDEDSILPVSTFPEGHYGIDEIALGVPAIVGRGGVKKVLDIPLSAEEREQLLESAARLSEALDGLKD